jgi:hypothetical protein
MVKIFKPSGGTHAGDTFRELLDMWADSGFCTLVESPDNYVWVGEPGFVLLYDYPRLDDREIPKYKYGLFGNTIPLVGRNERCFPWIFWARRPRFLEKEIEAGILCWGDRDIETIFLGKIENQIQYTNRTQFDWSSGVEFFSMPIIPGVSDYPFSQKDYLRKVKRAKFGLALPGYGPKCNREIEYLGLGVVPVMVDGCDTFYHNSLEEDIHYIKVRNPEEFKERVHSTTKVEWQRLSENGQAWYRANCSRLGSYLVTREAISRFLNGSGTTNYDIW